MNIIFRSNLDRCQGYINRLNETWNKSFEKLVPAVGSNIEFEFDKWFHDENRSRICSFELGVHSVRYVLTSVQYAPGNVIVELHMPKNFRYMNHGIEGADDGSIAAWEVYFKRHVEGKDY